MTSEPNDQIAAFYDANPYPPPLADLGDAAAGWDDDRRRIEHHRIWPGRPFRGDLSVLVAGCGTAQAARYAQRWPGARVTGVDVSTTALAHTRVLADRHGLVNLQLRELPVEEVDRLDDRFDLVVCTGVLHHLADPTAGLRALRGVLRPGGAVNLMVYALYGRTGVYMIQDYCRRLGIGTSPAEIAELKGSLRELPMVHPLSPLLRDTPDFGDDHALADALLNPRDRAYAVPELLALLTEVDLRFGRWVRQAPYLPWCGVLATIPHHARLASLDPPEQYAAAELFRGTMVRHSLYAHGDGGRDDTAVGFAGDGWHRFVPLLEPTVIALRERLPEGAAVAVLNRAHVDRDLVVFLTEDERRWFEAVDGRRTMAEIGGPSSFFERLWRHDLISIDAGAIRGDAAPGQR